MKNEAKKNLIKDLIIAGVGFTVLCLLCGGESLFMGIGCGLVGAGIPFGWRWLSKIYLAISPTALAIKLFLSMLVGWVAIFVVLGGDIARLASASRGEAELAV